MDPFFDKRSRFTLMFSNDTFSSFITHYVSARNSRSCVLLAFASTGALPDT
jgi:hypothetical protein